MGFGNRGSRSSDARRYTGFCPRRERLEDRLLLAIDLGGNPPPALPNIATANVANTPPGPFGVVLGGAVPSQGAGYSVSDVGDINADGFDDFFIGAPSVATNSLGNVVQGGSANTAAYLVYGSAQANATNINTVDWLGLNTTGQRVGDLGQLGVQNGIQTNPITGNPGFAYAGIQFITSSNLKSQLGSSISVVRGLNGGNALLIGAPAGLNANGANDGTGRTYLVYTNAALNNLAIASATTGTTQVVDLDNPPPGVMVITFVNNTPGGHTGSSVAGVGDLNADGFPDIAIGAPGATVAGSGLISSGAVYVVSGAAIPTTTQTINLSNVGQTILTTPTPIAGALFLGSSTAGLAGFSVAAAGDVNGALAPGGVILNDFLIGAPSTSAGGTAYLVYGATNLFTIATANPNNLFFLSLGALGSSASGINGAIFNGLGAGSNTGFTVAGAGDFNNDGFADIMIGSPQNGIPGVAGQGRVDVIYGQPQTTTSNGVFGTINLAGPPTGIESVTFTGPSSSSLAGYALSSLGRLVTGSNFPNDNLLIGTPGFNNNQGAVFLIPGNSVTLLGSFPLSDATQPVAATEITISNTVGAPFLGASLSGGTVLTGQTTTADNDALSDLIIGAPGFNVTGVTTGANSRVLAGGAFILEGAFTPVNVPSNTQITTQIGVGQAISTTGVFTVNATTPPALAIFVFSNASISPPFAPVTQILPGSIKVNGVAFPAATIATDPIDENKDGIPDAIITISPRAALNLTANTSSLTITGLTNPTGANPNKTWGGTASIIVTGAGGGIVVPVTSALPSSVALATALTLQFGPDVYVPSVAALSAYNYVAIPLGVAYNQYLPPSGFRQRIAQYFFPKKHLDQFGSRKEESGDRTSTLGRAVFTRGKFKPGKTISFTHKVRVVPIQDQHQTFIPTANLALVQKRSLT